MAQETSEHTCENCAFFHEVNHRQGQCRHDPPRVFPIPQMIPGPAGPQQVIQFQAQYPPVEKTEWCGQHSARTGMMPWHMGAKGRLVPQ